MVTMRPRRWAGAISARYSGTVAAAAPTAIPRMIRATSMIPKDGASELPRAPRRKRTAQNVRLPFRPNRSDSLPPIKAPSIAPNSSELTTLASCTLDRLRSSFRKGRAPEMTPVSYPKSSPPSVDMTVSLIRNRLFC
jgi:hypothetical protein